jgi:putative transposase
MDEQHTKHVTYKLAYHFVWCPKYRKKILVGKLATLIEQEICRICEANTWTTGALHMQADHVHLFLNAPPNVSPSRDGLTRSKAPLPARSFNASLK